MCGIVGVYTFGPIENHKELPFINWALTTMKNRGPDDEGIWSDEVNYIAGFRRLSIRDLSPEANQPMVSDCKKYVLNFNGEIYNTGLYKEKLVQLGYRFLTTSDTEILLYSLIQFGVDKVLSEVDGIFAFSFFDIEQNILTLARDRVGVKPLYIGKSTKGIVYSSQYDHIINHPDLKNNKLDVQAVGAYLQLGYVPENSGVFEHTFLLPHGHYIQVKNNSIQNAVCYYNYPFVNNSKTKKKRLQDVIKSSVKNQLVSDVPIGSFISGGIDSPLVTHFANQRKEGISTYNIGVTDAEFDESKTAKEYADIFGTQHHTKHFAEKELLEAIQQNIEAYSEPFADSSSLPSLILSEFVNKDMTVALSGDGGDELFFGYDRSVKVAQNYTLLTSSKIRQLLRLIIQKFFNLNRKISFKDFREKDLFSNYYSKIFITGAYHWLPRIYKEKPSKAYFYLKLLHEIKMVKRNKKTDLNIIRKMEFDIHLQRILLKVDRASMYNSLEVRVPLLNNKMLEESILYSYKDCIAGDNGKLPLKSLLSKLSSPELVFQKKKGFIVPVGYWMKNELKSELFKAISSPPDIFKPYFNVEEIKKMFTEHIEGKNDWSWMLWAIFSLFKWYDGHVDKFKA